MTQLANISPLNSNPSQYEQQRNLTDESDFASANRLQAKEEDTKQWSRIKITIDSIGRFRCRKRRGEGGRARISRNANRSNGGFYARLVIFGFETRHTDVTACLRWLTGKHNVQRVG